MTLREAAQQALEALEHEAEIGNDDAYRRERDALRAALAEVLPDDMTEGELAAYRAGWQKRSLIEPQRKRLAEPDLNHCPQCGGPADNGHDRCFPPNPYWCSKCMTKMEASNGS